MQGFYPNPLTITVTESQRDRLVDLGASAPMFKRPGDDELIRLGLAEFDADMDAVYPRYMPNGNICYYNARSGAFLPNVKHDANPNGSK